MKLPDKFKWIGLDDDGELWGFANKPALKEGSWDDGESSECIGSDYGESRTKLYTREEFLEMFK